MPAYTLEVAVYKQITTYPLTNQPRRRFMFFDPILSVAYVSDEYAQRNDVQILQYITKDITKRSLRLPQHISNTITIGGLSWNIATYSVKSHTALAFLTHISNNIVLPTTGFTLSYSPKVTKSIKLLEHKSDQISLYSSSQSISYGINKVKNSFCTSKHKSLSIALLTGSSVVEYSNKVSTKLKIQNLSAFITTDIELFGGTFLLNYGGENTFYSLNGFFNFFRYKYPSLMQTNYHIMISNKLINMYNSSMVCIESHKAGYKRVTVADNFLKDVNGEWLSKDTLAHLYYEDKFTFYSPTDKLLYTYNFDNITLTSIRYHNVDSILPPTNVDLFLDPTYSMPYIMPASVEGNQLITQVGEFWNFLQINNLKRVEDQADVSLAGLNYINEVFTPTSLYIDKILFRYKGIFLLQGSRGVTERNIYSVDVKVPSTFNTILTYNGSKVIYSEYPVIYYSEYNKNFTDTSVYNKLVKFNLETMDYDITKIDHYKYFIVKDTYIWHLCQKVSNSAYYLFREDEPLKVINLTTYFNLGEADILEFMVFNSYDIYVITSDRQVKTINIQSMKVVNITTIGIPILFIRFNTTLGCVLTRLNNKLYFEELQQIDWTTVISNWITPYDMKKGEQLLPYELYRSIMHARLAPITSQLNLNVVERTSTVYIELERGYYSEMTNPTSDALLYPVRVGKCEQVVYGNRLHSVINPIIESVGVSEYSKSLEIEEVLHDDNTFTLKVKDLMIPEPLTAGFKLYEK